MAGPSDPALAGLAARLAAVRREHRPGSAPVACPQPDRAEALARWFNARLEVAEGAATVVLERSVRLSPLVMNRSMPKS